MLTPSAAAAVRANAWGTVGRVAVTVSAAGPGVTARSSGVSSRSSGMSPGVPTASAYSALAPFTGRPVSTGRDEVGHLGAAPQLAALSFLRIGPVWRRLALALSDDRRPLADFEVRVFVLEAFRLAPDLVCEGVALESRDLVETLADLGQPKPNSL